MVTKVDVTLMLEPSVTHFAVARGDTVFFVCHNSSIRVNTQEVCVFDHRCLRRTIIVKCTI